MKRIFTILGMSVLLTAATCRSPQSTAFNSIASAEASVDSAYKAYLDLVVRGQVKTNDVPAISRKYEAFQAAERMAITLANGNSNAVPTTALNSATVDVLSAITTAKAGGK